MQAAVHKPHPPQQHLSPATSKPLPQTKSYDNRSLTHPVPGSREHHVKSWPKVRSHLWHRSTQHPPQAARGTPQLTRGTQTHTQGNPHKIIQDALTLAGVFQPHRWLRRWAELLLSIIHTALPPGCSCLPLSVSSAIHTRTRSCVQCVATAVGGIQSCTLSDSSHCCQ